MRLCVKPQIHRALYTRHTNEFSVVALITLTTLYFVGIDSLSAAIAK